jgi:hypothetical protein
MQSPGTGGRSQKSGVVARSRGDGGRRGWAVSLGWERGKPFADDGMDQRI